jgi:hypothetical protein
MAYPNFKKGLKMAFGPLGVKQAFGPLGVKHAMYLWNKIMCHN